MKQWYYVLDGQQQGPVSEAELQGLLAINKINSATLVWADGMAEWSAIQDVAELSQTAQVATAAASAAAVPAGMPAASATSVSLVTPGEFTVGSVLSEGWAVFKQSWLNIFLVGLVIFGFFIVTGILEAIVGAVLGSMASNLLSLFVSFVITPALMIGWWKVMLQIVDGGEFRLADVFSRFDKFWMAALTHIVFAIFIVVGLILLIIPGIIVALALQFWMAVCADEGPECDYLGSLKKSFELAKPHLLTLFVLALAYMGIAIIGVLLLVVGLIPASILIAACTAVAYRKLAPKVA
ncbi:DUF4339 domain-containing protein [Oscillatoria amoena NRMC-F 0135]|nr:DUF4339 domain-containing protein [Oscillatoria laete-virens]MDL5047493.1 DUF4339 domain-containing protein [Oscillatoria amoena NRMC-F 0135]MDL5054682.1 DUF4339 domain-containing protein [Oscillatoria laete-virens NRMC-F 0139]